MIKLDFKDAKVWLNSIEGVDVSDTEIQKMIDEVFDILIDEDEDSECDFIIRQTGNTAVIGYRCYYEMDKPVEINIIVTQDYKHTTLHKRTRWELD